MTERAPRPLFVAFVLYAYRFGAALVVSYPVARSLGAFGGTPFEGGDRVLFEDGALRLLEALRFGAASLAGAVQAASVGVLLLSFAGLLPLTWAFVALDGHGRRAPVVPRTASLLPAFVLLWGATWLARVTYGVLAALLVGAAAAATKNVVDERLASVPVIVASALVAAGLFAVSVAEDVVRAALVKHDGPPLLRAFGVAQRAILAAPGRVVLSAAGPLFAGAALIVVGAWLTGVIDVSRPGALRVAGVFVVHQAVALALAALRVRWLGAALALVPERPANDSATGVLGASGDRLLVDLDVAPSGPVPGEIEPHDPPA